MRYGIIDVQFRRKQDGILQEIASSINRPQPLSRGVRADKSVKKKEAI